MAETQTFQNPNNFNFPPFQQHSNLLQSDLQPRSSPPVTLISPSFSSDLFTTDFVSPSFASNQTNVPNRGGTSTTANLSSSPAEDGGSVAESEGKSSTVFIGRLSKECTRDMVVNVFAIIGPISEIKFWPGRSYAFVSYLSPVSAAKAVFALNGSCVFGSPIFVGWPSASVKKQSDQGSDSSSPSFSKLDRTDCGSNFASSVGEDGSSVDAEGNGSTVFIGRLPNECTRDMVGRVFEKLGPISEIRLWSERSYAFVSYLSPVSAANAVVCLNGSCVFGSPIFVGWPSAIVKKQSDQGLNLYSPSLNAVGLCDLSIETGVVLSTPTAETILSQIWSLQETISQVLINQKEGKRIETDIGNKTEKAYNAIFDAQWGRIQEEFSKLGKSNRDDYQQICGLVTNGFKDLLAAWEKTMKKETPTLVHAVVSTVTPIIEKTVSTAISEAFQEALKLSMEGCVVPAFEKSCKSMFDQVNVASQEKIDVQVDSPTKELSRLLYEHKYEEAFTMALQRSDVRIVFWLCSQVDLQGILMCNPVPLSQGVLLSLVHHLACDVVNDTSRKLAWMMDLVAAINPSDGVIAMHVRPIFDRLHSILNHQLSLPTTSVSDLSSIRILMKLIDSTLRSL